MTMDATTTDAPKSRQERLAEQRAAALAWARTATTDDIPGDLAPPPTRD